MHLYGSARGHLIEILIRFQRSACSSFTSHGLSKQPRLAQSIALMNMLIKIGKRPSLKALQVSCGRRLISLTRPPRVHVATCQSRAPCFASQSSGQLIFSVGVGPEVKVPVTIPTETTNPPTHPPTSYGLMADSFPPPRRPAPLPEAEWRPPAGPLIDC